MLKHLPDGTPLLVRKIRADDKRLLEQGLTQLSPRSVYLRFLAPKPRFSRAELRYLTEVDGRNHVALVVESPAQPVRRLIASGRFVRHGDDPRAAEAAIVVADNWQGRGVGSLLAVELGKRARGLGIERFTATMAAENVPAHRLMQKLTQEVQQRHEGSVDELVARIAA
jgi:RimJ/RimL family protein N-acetyltransferase